MRALITLTLAISTACGGDGDITGVTHTVSVNGVTRTYRLVVPPTPSSGPMPLVLALHGGGGRDVAFPQEPAFRSLAHEQGFVMAYPLAEHRPGNEGEWQLNTTAPLRHDMDFLEALIDQVSAQHAIDESRIYATGYSLGSMFSYELPCHLSERFAAIASHAGTMPVSPSSCSPTQPMGILHLHGTEDSIIPYATSWNWKAWDQVGPMRDIPSLIEFWRNAYRCEAQDQPASADSRHIIHASCDGGVRVEHHQLTGVGHEWPDEINGTSTHRVIWNFLSGFSRSL